MAIIKKSKIRELSDAELKAKLFEFQKELNSERGMLATGGRAANAGKIRGLKCAVARIMTILHERKLGVRTNAKNKKSVAEGAKKPVAAAKPK